MMCENKIKISSLFLILLPLVLTDSSTVSAQIKTRIELVRGGDPIMRKGISKVLTQTVQEINKTAEGEGEMDSIERYCTEEGYQALNSLVENTGFLTTAREYRLTLLGTPSGNYEVRGITGRVNMGQTEGDPVQEVVFVLNWQAFIIDVHFAMELHHYEALLSDGQKLKDGTYREQVLNFLEQFRTAHNTKNIAFLEKTYSDDALIIVGRKVERKESEVTQLADFAKGKIEFIKKSKTEYMESLRRVFIYNSFVKVSFDSVTVVQHPKFNKIYGITLKQRWNSSNYSDEGYLFVMMDFRAPDTVLVRVRSWQPDKFEDGSTIDLSYFHIVGSN